MRDATHVEALIPHRLPMRLVEGFEDPVDEHMLACAEVRASWPTVCGGAARTLILIELIAQSAGVLQGFRERAQGKPVSGGLLVGIPALAVSKARIPVGTQLRCSVSISHGAPNYLVFDGRVTDTTGELWLAGSVQAYRVDDCVLGDQP
jgi:predicted hotdog family 3-hydroxylacyl-ACP dehydratase